MALERGLEIAPLWHGGTCAHPLRLKVSLPSILFVSALIVTSEFQSSEFQSSEFQVRNSQPHTPEEDNGD